MNKYLSCWKKISGYRFYSVLFKFLSLIDFSIPWLNVHSFSIDFPGWSSFLLQEEQWGAVWHAVWLWSQSPWWEVQEGLWRIRNVGGFQPGIRSNHMYQSSSPKCFSFRKKIKGFYYNYYIKCPWVNSKVARPTVFSSRVQKNSSTTCSKILFIHSSLRVLGPCQ